MRPWAQWAHYLSQSRGAVVEHLHPSAKKQRGTESPSLSIISMSSAACSLKLLQAQLPLLPLFRNTVASEPEALEAAAAGPRLAAN